MARCVRRYQRWFQTYNLMTAEIGSLSYLDALEHATPEDVVRLLREACGPTPREVLP